MFSGNKCPPAMYSKANNMKMTVETSSSQNASKAMVYDIKNCNARARTIDAKKPPQAAASGGATRYCRSQKIKMPSGTNDIAAKIILPERNRHIRYTV